MPSASPYPPSRPQSIGEVLDSGFRIFRMTLLRCLPYGAVIMIVSQLANMHQLLTGRPLKAFPRHDPVWWLWYAIGLFLSVACSGALILRQNALATGVPTSTSAELRTVVARFPELLIVGVLALLGIMLGLLLLVLPGLYLALAFLFAVPALLLRPCKPTEALRYSAWLVHRNWWRTFLTIILTFFVMIAFEALIGVLAAISGAILGVADLAVVSAISTVAGVALGAVSLPFMWAVILALYGDLQVRREGLDLERRVAQAVEI
ncbi:MAG TPA: hypothetical protein VMG11_11835 [Steroidobacteraceae bacterium]|nr:hypothetical protein [Steroidobacteraceae bacterium]